MPIGHPLIHLATTTSTMDDAARFAGEGAPEGLVVVADEQTAGRGRAGREWVSRAGAGLYCSILLRPTVDPSRLTLLPLLAGVAVAESIESLVPVSCELKWPNDVWIHSRKVAGLLTTFRSAGEDAGVMILGIGVNLTAPVADLPPGSTSILAATGVSLDPRRLLEVLIDRLGDRLPPILHENGSPDLRPWLNRAALIDEPVFVVDAGTVVEGVMRGVDATGALLVESGDTLVRVVAGDLTRGPVAQIAHS